MSAVGIRVQGLVKEFPRTNNLLRIFARSAGPESIKALRGIDLELQSGKIHGLIGPNGAGKTTLLKIIAGLSLPTQGQVLLDGEDIEGSAKARQAIGFVVANDRSFFWRLTVLQNLMFFAVLQEVLKAERKERVLECLRAVGLESAASQTYHSISTGMRQRLAIARGLLSKPRILLLDEATRSLDPEAALEVRTLVRQLIAQDSRRIILYSSHNLAEVEDLCDHLFVLREGLIVADEAICAEAGGQALNYRFRLRDSLPEALARSLAVQPNADDGRVFMVHVRSPQEVDQIVDQLRQGGLGIAEFGPVQDGLEDRFFGERGPSR